MKMLGARHACCQSLYNLVDVNELYTARMLSHSVQIKMTQRHAACAAHFCTLFKYFRAKTCSTRKTAVMQAITTMPFKLSPCL